MMAATLIPCVRGVHVRGCGLVSYGQLRAATEGVSHPQSDSGWYGALGLRVGAETHLWRRLRVGLHVDGLASLTDYQAKLGDAAVWNSSRLAGLLGLDGAWDIE
jgi:hypothetical protein